MWLANMHEFFRNTIWEPSQVDVLEKSGADMTLFNMGGPTLILLSFKLVLEGETVEKYLWCHG